MSTKENILSAIIILVLGFIVYFLIPYQVGMDPVPGSMGFSEVGPSTLPSLSAWGFILIGLIWLSSEALKYFNARRNEEAVTIPNEEIENIEQREKWGWSLLLWVGAVIYVALIPVLGYAESCIIFSLPLSLAMIRSRSEEFHIKNLFGLLIGVIIFPILLHLLFYRFLYVDFPTGIISRFFVGG